MSRRDFNKAKQYTKTEVNALKADNTSQVSRVTIAASNAPSIEKRRANYVCDGVNDNDIMVEAITFCIENKCDLYLTKGIFNTTLDVSLPPDTITPTDVDFNIIGTLGTKFKIPSDNTTGINISGIGGKRLSLTKIVSGDVITINGLTYTAHTSTDIPNRKFLAGNNNETKVEFLKCISDGIYGVPSVISSKGATKLTLTSVVVGDVVTINGITFTAANATNVALREFYIGGSNEADAVGLKTCINDVTYGVSGIAATNYSNVITLATVNNDVVVTNASATIVTTDSVTMLSDIKITYTLASSTFTEVFEIFNLMNLKLKNIRIIGATGNLNNIGLKMSFVQNVYFENIRVDQCYGGGFKFNDVWDSKFYNTDLIQCGKANSDIDYAYALELNQVHDNCNALYFYGLRIELSPCMVHSNGRNRHNFIIGGKFEKSTENKTTIWNPIKLNNPREIVFANIFCVNSHRSFDNAFYYADNGLYFIYSTDSEISTGHQRQRIKFINCNFTTNGFAYTQWANVVSTSFFHCDFFYTSGGLTQAPFYFRGYCNVKDTFVSIVENSRWIQLGNKYNNIEMKVLIESTNPTLSSIWLDSTADDNEVKYSLVKNQFGISHILATDFLANGYTYLKNNQIKDNTKKYITTTSSTVNINSANIIKAGGDVSLISMCSNGQEITLMATANITINHSAYLVLKNGANTSLASGKIMRLMCIDSIVYEI